MFYRRILSRQLRPCLLDAPDKRPQKQRVRYHPRNKSRLTDRRSFESRKVRLRRLRHRSFRHAILDQRDKLYTLASGFQWTRLPESEVRWSRNLQTLQSEASICRFFLRTISISTESLKFLILFSDPYTDDSEASLRETRSSQRLSRQIPLRQIIDKIRCQLGLRIRSRRLRVTVASILRRMEDQFLDKSVRYL